MTNIIDITDRLRDRNGNQGDLKERATLVKSIIEGILVGTEWSTIYPGVTQLSMMEQWSDAVWASFALNVEHRPVEAGNDYAPAFPDAEFDIVHTFDTAFRRQYVPEFGCQAHTEFMCIVGRVKQGRIKSRGMSEDDRSELLHSFVDYAKSFSEIVSTKLTFQLGFLVNLFEKNDTVHLHSFTTTPAGKFEVELSVPAKSPDIPLRLHLTCSFDFLPLVLDHLATQLVLQQPDEP